MPAMVSSSAPAIRIGPPTPIEEAADESRSASVHTTTTTTSLPGNISDYYGLRWLFDEDNPTHLPIEEKVLQYKVRDLRKTKLYMAATSVFWTPPSRKRVIIANSDYVNRNARSPPAEPRPPEVRSAPVFSQTQREETHREETVPDPLEYKSWIAERKALRADLNSMGLNEAYLRRKPNKTSMERSVLGKMVEDRTPKPIPPVIPEDPPYNLKLGDNIPRFRRPCPEAIIVIEEFLSKKKLRLVDLFKNVDKKKKWVVTREEFTDAVKKAGIPLSEMALEDLIVSLDIDMDNCIDYRELVKGMKDWKLQKKRDKQRLLADQVVTDSVEETKTSKIGSGRAVKSGNSSSSQPMLKPTRDPSRPRPSLDSRLGPIRDLNAAVTYDVTGDSVPDLTSQPMDPNRLTPPEVDTSPDRMDLDSDESMVSLRKRNRETIKSQHKKKATTLPKTDFYDGRSMIKIGDVAIDNHCRPSTLVGDVGVLVDKFRQERLREYQQAVRICEDYDVPLSKRLLTKVLLYPPDKPQSLLKRKLRQPGGPLLSRDQFRPKRHDTSTATANKKGVPVRSRERRAPASSYNERAPARSYFVLPEDSSPTSNNERVDKGRPQNDDRCRPLNYYDDDEDDDDFYRGRYRPRRNKAKKMYLSTGKAYVSRKVDCWMTFEEYERFFTKIDATMFTDDCDESAFWPGQLLDKLRLCMPPYESRHKPPTGVACHFRDVTKTAKRAYPGHDNDLNLWPQNGQYLMMGRYDPYKNKY